MKFALGLGVALVTAAWSFKINVSQETETETAQCTCQMGDTAAGSSFTSSAVTYIKSFLASSQPMCFSADDISDATQFGWHPPDNTGCHTGFYEKGHPLATKLLNKCLPSHANGPAVYLIGDSHAFVMQHGLKKASTMPVYHASWQFINDAKQATDVFPEYLRSVVKANDIIAFLSKGPSYKAHAIKFVALAKEKQLKLILLGDFPTLSNAPGLCFHKSQPGSETSCSLPKATSQNSSPKKANDDYAKEEAAANPGQVFFHDLTESICPNTKCDMWVPATSHPAYMDQYHVNKVGSSYMAQSLCTFLNTNGLYTGGLSVR